jgi:hypothetical protein
LAWRRDRSGLWVAMPEIAGGALRRHEPYQLKLLALAKADANGRAVASLVFPANAIGRTGVISRLIASVATPFSNPALSDNFNRTVAAGGWGTPSTVGPPYSVIAGTVARFAVNGTQGTIAIDPATQAIASPIGLSDMNAYVHLTGSNATGLIVRAIDGNNYYFATIAAAGGVYTSNTLTLAKRVAGAESNLITNATCTLGQTDAQMRLQVSGNNLSATAWNLGVNEPAPQAIAIDLDLAAASGVGCRKTDNLVGTATYDDLLVTSAGLTPSWDAYLGDPTNPVNLRDSSAGVALSRWVPSLVNGQPFYSGDVLNIVATGASPGQQITVTSYLQMAGA